MKKSCLAILALTVVFIAGCDPPIEGGREILSDSGKVTQIDNVIRVFMHRPQEFTFFSVTNSSSKRIIINHFDIGDGNKTEIFMDVPDDKPMWARYGEEIKGKPSKSLEIHIHAVGDINGAGWIIKNDDTTITGTTDVVR